MSKADTLTTHYPDYDVLKLTDEWDSHTMEIILKRLGPFSAPGYFSEWETASLKAVIQNLVFDNRDNIIDWIVFHLDNKMTSQIGEDQRKSGLPPENVLIREGLAAIDHASRQKFGKGFKELDGDKQFKIISALQLGQLQPLSEWSRIPQRDLFSKLLTEIVSAYYSHPEVWSEIGYGGPAYPRGYVRIEYGLTDPWEARGDGK
ncbi:MAG TPA: gluconate 2-dehydrogenase subunit 3 family protein [Desulfobacteria bacterium]|nr:gluconate 2-dehydrogenase subunit 3 family protein [Desulfobacteria bacterium]